MDHRYSKFIRPLFKGFDFVILNLCSYLWVRNFSEILFFVFYINVVWFLISYYTEFYNVHRYTRMVKLLHRSFVQYVIFFMAYFTYFSIFYEGISIGGQQVFLGSVVGASFIFRLFMTYALRFYRIEGYSFRRVISIGSSPSVTYMVDTFEKRKDYGYRYLGGFSKKSEKDFKWLGEIDDYKDFVLDNEVHEIYCSLTGVPKKVIRDMVQFCDENLIVLKFIPDEKGVFRRSLSTQFYGHMPILVFRDIALSMVEVRFIKRIFDILFSSFVILFVLSWLYPILGFFIKRESQGPILFKQQRDGIDGKPFWCYKFRSMGVNKDSDVLMATKNDVRVTKIGAFMRRTSIDELPQFFNVFLGNMSVVGPRPHMINQRKEFSRQTSTYMVRHFVKPGITGLAQIKGYRGEIETKKDIVNRVKYDVFYVEHWSFLLDIRVIFRTVYNAIKGEDKAY